MSRNEIVMSYYKDIQELIIKLLGRSNVDYVDDLTQDIIIILLELNEPIFNRLVEGGDIMRFTNKVITNQFRSTTSKFYRKYKRYNENKEQLTTEDGGYKYDFID